MSGNLHRFTASRILFVFAVALFLVSLLALQIRLKREQLEWIDYPTALGDSDFYDPEEPIGEDDFFEPNLCFSERPDGIYRRNRKPQRRLDEDMLILERDATDAYFVYTPRDRKAERVQPNEKRERRFFLKATDDGYIEFGERKYWPEFVPESGARDENQGAGSNQE